MPRQEPPVEVTVAFRVEHREDGKWYGAMVVAGEPTAQSRPYDTAEEAHAECHLMIAAMHAQLPQEMAAKGFRAEIIDVVDETPPHRRPS